MKDMVKVSMESVKRKLNADYRKYCFELFGYDFIIDENFKTWLIEVNTNPCLEESSRLLQILLPRLIDDMLKLTVDAVFPRKRRDFWQRPGTDAVHKVSGYSDYENMWEQIGDLSLPQRRGRAKLIFKDAEAPHSANTSHNCG
eukprot:TRINITY_DN9586_c0_g3_i1.p1 TRINITY_DN9586_c0_g3~~TRINITY_DN9586_c0_g3_i1.p1  ORF type:complete len:143 (-),score=30.20 TRINITY_DN9586_c0_g3_i1:110-538(-)